MGTTDEQFAVATAVGPRLTPDDRRRHLLGVARALVETEGVSALTLERVATDAGVSRALIYTYFENRPGLIRALWSEVSALWDIQPMPPYEQLLASSTPRELFDRRLRENTRWFLDQIEASGLLFHRLMSEPLVESEIDDVRQRVERDNISWWTRLVEALGVEPERAHVFSTLVNTSSQTIWSLVARGESPRDVIEDVFFLSCGATLDALLAESTSDRFD